MELPAKLIAEKQRLAQEAKAKPEGWWSISGEGSVNGVNTAVDNSDLPAHWKAAIKADIAARCVGELNFVYLDAHCHIEKGKQVVNYTLTADKKLL